MIQSAPGTRTVKKPGKGAVLMLVLLAVGLALTTLQFIMNIGSYVGTLFTHVEQPTVYRFDTYDRLLKKVVKGNLVDYDLLLSSAELKAAVDELAHTSPARLADPSQQLAFWINAYNLLSLKNITDSYPVRTVLQLQESEALHKFLVGGRAYSLQDIRIWQLQPLFMKVDARGAMLICSGAAGDPQLVDHAIQPETMRDDMEHSSFLFVNDPQTTHYDMDKHLFILSRYFKVYELPFDKQYYSAFRFANKYLENKVDFRDPHLHTSFDERFDFILNDVALADPIRRFRLGSPDQKLPVIPMKR